MACNSYQASYPYLTALNLYRAGLRVQEGKGKCIGTLPHKELLKKSVDKFTEVERRKHEETLKLGLESLNQAIDAEYEMYCSRRRNLESLKIEITESVKVVQVVNIEELIKAHLVVTVQQLMDKFGDAIESHVRPIIVLFQKELACFLQKVKTENRCLEKALEDIRKQLRLLQIAIEAIVSPELQGRLSFTLARK